MFHDRVSSNTGTSRKGPQSLPVTGPRKRSRPSSSSSSDTRLVPRDPSTRAWSKLSEQRGKVSTPPRNVASAKAGGLATSGGVGSNQSAHRNAEEYLDDVRFDVTPRDMCIVGSQDFARSEDDRVVMEELCSLGSVLAGGRGDESMMEEESADPNADDGNSKGSRDDSSHGGCNLLTRWLQPASGSCPIDANSNSNQGTVGDAEESLADLDGLAAVGGDGVGGEAQGGTVGSTVNGSKIVSDWARRALLRKKMADAERGRKLRTQLRGDTAASGSRLGSEVPNAFPQDGELAPSSNRNSTSGLPTTPASPGKQSENRRDSHDTDHAGKSARGGSATAAPTGACVERGGSVIGFSRTGEESGKGAGVEESDGYGDDFDFLSEAELKAMEDEAAKVSASQRASQIPVKELSVNCHPRTWPSSRDGRVVENRSDKPGERSLMDETSRDVGSNAREQDSNGCKRPAGPTGRSHLASSGEKTKLGDNGKHNGRFASSQSNCGAVMGNGDGQAMASETLPRFKHGSDQATNQEVAVHASSDVMNAVKREYREGLVEEPSADREGSAGDAVGLEPRSKSLGNGDAHAEEFNPRKASWSSSWSQAKNAMGPNGTAKPPLFARNGGMSQYAASMPFASGVAKRASDVSSDPKSGPGVGIDGADRRPQERMLTKDPGDDLGGARNSPARELGSGTRPSDFSPAFVHRRFLVLEVSYGRCGHGAGPGGGSPREKILMALEQLCEVMPGSTANGSEGAATEAVGERSTVSQKRQIALRGDWYDCEVEPGELVHVIVPVGRQSSRRASVPIADVGTKEALDSEHVVLDNVSGKLLIVQPDILVSPTKVADTVLCARKAVLQSRIASDASKSKAAVLGSLKHELFETSLLAAAASARVSAETVSNPTATAASAWQAVGRDRVMGGASKGGGRQSERQLLSSQYMAALVDRIILSQLEALYGAGLDECTARRELLAVSLPILTWHRSFLVDRRPCVGLTAGRASVPSDGGAGSVESSYAVNQPGGRTSRRRSGGFPADPRGLASLGPDGIPAAKVQVARVLSTEDDVWSPVLGLKGILDVTVEAEVEMLTRGINNVAASDSRRAWDRNRGRGSGPGGTAPGSGLPPGVVADRAGGSQRALVMPVEVKTGKRIGDAHSAHRAQVMLYTLLMRVRYGNEACPSGLLVYTSGEGLHTELISPVPAEIRALVLARNRYASGMAKVGRVGLVRSGLEGVADGGQPGGSALPPVIRRPRECGMCFQLSECMLYHRAAEGGDEESSGLDQGVFDKKVGHLSEAHLTFFSHWDRAIDLEGKIGEQVRSSMWQESGPERESRTGKCMSTLIWLGERDCDASAPRTTPDGHVVSVEGSPLGDAGAKRFVHVFARRWAAPELLSRESRGRQKHGDRASPAVRDGIEARSAMREESTTMVEHPLLRPKWARPLTDLSLAVGDMVCISSEGGVGNVWGSLPEKSGVQEIASRPHGGHEVDHCRLLTGNIAAIFKDTVEVFSEKRMRVPRRGGRRSRGLGGGGNGSEAGQPLDIEDLLGEARPGAPVGGAGGVLDSGSGKAGEGTVFFRIDKDEWAAGIK